MNLIIRNGHIIDPSQGIDYVDDLLITEDRIAQIGSVEFLNSPYRIINAMGMIVCPGFIDIHCHLRQPGFEEKETIASGTRAAAKGGFTTVCCMPNTNPPLDTKGRVRQIHRIAEEQGLVNVLLIGCVTKGRKGKELVDMLGLRGAGVVAESDDASPVWNSEIMRRALEQSKTMGLPIVNHCEDLSLSKGGGISAAAEERMVERDIELTRQTGGRLHIAHVSTAGSVELISQAKKRGMNVTAEVTPHHLTLTEEAVTTKGANAKVNPALRSWEDVEALIGGLREGVIDAIATDHAPHTQADKSCDVQQAEFGISGFETALGSVMSLFHQGKLHLPSLVSKLTLEPAQVIGRSGLMGNIKVGSPADVTIFHPNAEWTVDPEQFVSRGKNTPLAGALLKGKVMATIMEGNIVYKDESLIGGQHGNRLP